MQQQTVLLSLCSRALDGRTAGGGFSGVVCVLLLHHVPWAVGWLRSIVCLGRTLGHQRLVVIDVEPRLRKIRTSLYVREPRPKHSEE